MPKQPIGWETIGKKRVFFADAHHEVLEGWYDIFVELGRKKVIIISFDYHTDCHKAFLRHAFWNVKGNRIAHPDDDEVERAIQKLISVIRLDTKSTIKDAIVHLKKDEHIDCAIRIGIVNNCFLNLGRNRHGIRLPNVHVFSFDLCWPRCQKPIHDDDCELDKANLVIESKILKPRVTTIETAIGPLEESNLIIDIDLDIFNSKRAISATNADAFKTLLKCARAVTVARESGCVDELSLESSQGFNAVYLEAELRKIIQSV